MARFYLDHASSSPLRPAAFDAMLPFLRDHFGDPGRLHQEGLAARERLEVAREQVAALVGARQREVVFTSSGTEAANAAVWGAVTRGTITRGTRSSGLSSASSDTPNLVATAVEHSAVLDACRRSPAELTIIGVDRLGRYDPDEVLAAVRPATALVSVQSANHEVGTLQPVAAVVESCRERGVLVHVDACTSVGYEPFDFHALGADLCSITAHKLGGPKGVGALLVRRGLRLPSLIVGGSQERARRGGIENVAACVGFGAAAAELANSGVLTREANVARSLTDRVLDEAPALVGGVRIYGDPVQRVPHIVCIGIDGVEAEPVLLALDQHGVAVHSGSSCSSESLEPSPVLQAMGVDAEHSLRISTGWCSTPADIDALLPALAESVAKLRDLRTPY